MLKTYFVLIFLISSLSNHAFAADGKAIHDEKCLSCHQTEVYTRTDHKVTSLYGLGRQVSMCSQNLNTGWFPEDEKSVVKYLNDTFYHLKK